MNNTRSILRPLASYIVGLLAFVVASSALAQQGNSEYTPSLGQAGKDVMWHPTPDPMVDRMLRMAEVTSLDFVVDLGSGDGKISIAAARDFGARALGIEYNPAMVELSKRRARQAGVQDKVEFRQADIFATDFSNADVVTLYLLPELNLKLRPTLLKMKPGTRISSYSFDMGNWRPDETTFTGNEQTFLWVIPAHVAGTWTIDYPGRKTNAPGTLVLRQRFQNIEGEASLEHSRVSLQNARMRGTSISFGLRDARGQPVEFSGQVMGNRIVGHATSASLGRTRFEALRSTTGPAFEEAGAEAETEATKALGGQ